MELLAAAKHYWKTCVAIVAACTLAAACVFGFVLKPQYEATSSITVMDPSGSVSTTALTTVVNDCVAQYGSAEGDSSIASSAGTGVKSQTVSITVEESSPEEAVLIANQAAQYAAEEAESYFASLEERRQKVLAEDNSVVEGSDESLLIQQQGERSYAFCDFIVKDATGASAAGIGVAKGTTVGSSSASASRSAFSSRGSSSILLLPRNPHWRVWATFLFCKSQRTGAAAIGCGRYWNSVSMRLSPA